MLFRTEDPDVKKIILRFQEDTLSDISSYSFMAFGIPVMEILHQFWFEMVIL